MMKYSNNTNITDMIKDYIKLENFDYAILIDGLWGCGKTYYVKNKVIPTIEKEIDRKAIYISLYGSKNVEEIAEKLFSAIVEKRIGKKLTPAFTTGIKVVKDIIGSTFGSETIGNINVREAFSPTIEYNKFFFVFDDLERCSISINEVLGYLNYFNEQNRLKMIIIANQSEIGSINKHKNMEHKYYLALNESIVWPEKESDSPFVNKINKKSEKPVLDIDELYRRIDYLFDEDKLYSQIKEKLIGQTFYYVPDLDEIVPMLVARHINKELIKNGTENLYVNIIINTCKEEDCYNLRTIQFALLLFSKILNIQWLDDDKDSELFIEVLCEVLTSIIKIAIYYKNGQTNFSWTKDAEYGYVYRNDKWRDIFSFKFIHDYIFFSDYNKDRIGDVLFDYYEKKKRKNAAIYDPCNRLTSYMSMEDEEITTQLSLLYSNLQNGYYEGSSYRWILSILYCLKGIGIEPIPVQDFIVYIKGKVSSGCSILSYQEPLILQTDACYKEFEKCMEELYELDKHNSDRKSSVDINDVFDIESWGDQVYQYYSKKQSDIVQERKFFFYINIKKCLTKINASPAKEIFEFRKSLNNIYNANSFAITFKDDIENISILKGELENLSVTGKVKKRNIDLLVSQLASIKEIILKQL